VTPSYAILFKTHFWDDFTIRQLERVKSRTGRGDVYVVVDATFQPAPPIGYGRIIHINRSDISMLGLAPITTHGSIIWYNIDYPHYVALSQLPTYDYYVTIEYDTVVTVELDQLIGDLHNTNVDYLGFPIRTAVSTWPWFEMHLDIYGSDMLVYLSCFSVFSHRALTVLLARRQAMGLDFGRGVLEFWPNNEAFIPNEMRKAGMRIDTLDQYGQTRHYDWWPPLDEKELGGVADHGFIHPVLHGTRYIRSLVHHEPLLTSFFRRDSLMRRKLSGFSPEVVNPILRSELRRRVREKIGGTLERVGLRRRWFSNAQAGSARNNQRQSAHNAG
jgi:hypothetical protein